MSREALYELIWTKPGVEIAREHAMTSATYPLRPLRRPHRQSVK
jgi:hypothetical protein